MAVFGTAMRRFESSRPSQQTLVLRLQEAEIRGEVLRSLVWCR